MKISEIQIQSIIEAIIKELNDRIENVEWSDSDFTHEGPYSSWGRGDDEGDIEEVLSDKGLPDVDYANTEVVIYCKYHIDYTVVDDYDPGDYWTAPAGGCGVDEAEGSISDLHIEIVIDKGDDWEEVEVPAEVLERIVKEVNEKVYSIGL